MSPSAFAPPLPWVPMDAVVRWVWLPAPSKQARVGPNGKHTFLIAGPLTDFLLSNVNPEQWKTNSSRKLGAMNYQIPNKYVSEGNDHPTILREGVAGHGWLLCFFSQEMWGLFLYIALCLRVSTLGPLLMEQWWLFLLTSHTAIFQCGVLWRFPLVLRKSLAEESPVLLCHWPWWPWAGGHPPGLSFPFGMISISPIASV